MSAAQLLGLALMASPFLLLAVACIREGWDCFLFVFGLTAAVIGIIAAGSYLFTGSLS